MSTQIEGREKYREFKLTSFAIDHRTSMLVLTGIIILLGMMSYATIPKESTPEIIIPNVFVSTVYPGVAPKDIETLLTRPLEEELNNISDVKTITSVSAEGYSTINVEFMAGMDMNEALQKVRERVDLARPKLPSAAEEPNIIEINISEFPIMYVNVAGNYDLVRLREVAESLQDELEQIPGVLEVTLAGGLEREVQVNVDLGKLKYYGLAFKDVTKAIRNENVTIPGGSIDVGAMKYLVRVPGEFTDTNPIGDLVIMTRNNRPIYVRDVAEVVFGFLEQDTYARLDGKSVVTLGVKNRSGMNIIETADAVRATIAAVEPTLPTGTVIKITSDESESIKNMVSSLENNIISGLILVIGILLFFMGVRNASFVGVAIPLSMLLSFSIIQIVGFSMNMVVLFSLILALGMLVDNAIVVVENIYRFREAGFEKIEAAKLATAEVAMPIIASTATTLAVFFPLVFWPGIVGEFMKFLPYTLIITLSSSLFVGLVIIPTLCSIWLEPEGAPKMQITPMMKYSLSGIAAFLLIMGLIQNWLTTVLLVATMALLYTMNHFILLPSGRWLMHKGLPAFLVIYERSLRSALRHRFRIMAGTTALFILTFAAFAKFNNGVEFFPENIPPSAVYIQVETPLGTNVDETDRIARMIEHELYQIEGWQDYKSMVTTSGQSTSAGFGGGQGTHLATVAVHFQDFEDLQFDSFGTEERIKNMLDERVAGGEFSLDTPDMGPPTGAAINIEVSGEDPDRLKILGDELVQHLQQSALFYRLDGLESDMAATRPELIITVDREKAALWGLNTGDVGQTVRSAINGTEASKYRDGKDEYDITVRLARKFRENLDAIGDLTVVNEDGDQIPISSIATWKVGLGSGDVKRKDLDRVVTVSAGVRTGENANAVLADVRRELADYKAALPAGYALRFTGQQEEQQESEDFLSRTFLVAILFIALILISQFDSVIKPAIIISSVILSIMGVLMGLLMFNMPFVIVMTGVGVISLAGVVVNNAIVLIDYIDTLRHRDGMDYLESLVVGGRTRFRPVILTAITTVLGMMPLAVGLNMDFIGLYTKLNPDLYWGGMQAAMWGPMAIAVIAGLTFATFLTLMLIPVMVSLADDMETFFARNFLPAKSEQSEEALPAET